MEHDSNGENSEHDGKRKLNQKKKKDDTKIRTTHPNTRAKKAQEQRDGAVVGSTTTIKSKQKN